MTARDDLEAQLMEAMSRLSDEDRAAFEKLIEWIAFGRPKDAEPLTMEKMEELLRDIKLENTRRRLGGKVGMILPFKRDKSEDQ